MQICIVYKFVYTNLYNIQISINQFVRLYLNLYILICIKNGSRNKIKLYYTHMYIKMTLKKILSKKKGVPLDPQAHGNKFTQITCINSIQFVYIQLHWLYI
jgi:hypothetical protein